MKSITLSDKIAIIKRQIIRDERGWFFKELTGKEEGLPHYTGEIYTVCALPGCQRGGHYHKVAKEWFTVITGQALLKLKDIETEEVKMIQLTTETPVTVVVPPLIAHQFENHSENEFILLAYTDQLYDPADTISYSF